MLAVLCISGAVSVDLDEPNNPRDGPAVGPTLRYITENKWTRYFCFQLFELTADIS